MVSVILKFYQDLNLNQCSTIDISEIISIIIVRTGFQTQPNKLWMSSSVKYNPVYKLVSLVMQRERGSRYNMTYSMQDSRYLENKRINVSD